MRSILPSFGAGDRELSRRITRMIWGRHHVLLATVLAVVPWLIHYLGISFYMKSFLAGWRGVGLPREGMAIDLYQYTLFLTWEYVQPLSAALIAAIMIRRFLRSPVYQEHIALTRAGRLVTLHVVLANLTLLAIYTHLVSRILVCARISLGIDPVGAGMAGAFSSALFGVLRWLDYFASSDPSNGYPLWFAILMDILAYASGILTQASILLFFSLSLMAAPDRAFPLKRSVTSVYLMLLFATSLTLQYMIGTELKCFGIETKTAMAAGDLIYIVNYLLLLLATLYWWHRKVSSGPLDIESQE